MEPGKIWPWLDPGSIRLGHLGSLSCGVWAHGLGLPRLRVPKGVGSLKTPGEAMDPNGGDRMLAATLLTASGRRRSWTIRSTYLGLMEIAVAS